MKFVSLHILKVMGVATLVKIILAEYRFATCFSAPPGLAVGVDFKVSTARFVIGVSRCPVFFGLSRGHFVSLVLF